MVLTLNYSDLSSMISETNKLSTQLDQYSSDLSKKVQKKINSVRGGSSAALSSADYYVDAKIKQINARKANAQNLSTKADSLLETAKRVDKDVKKMIEANQKAFFKKNPDLKPSGFKLAVISFLTWGKDTPIIGWLIKQGEKVAEAYHELCKSIKDWYENGGGKELLASLAKTIAAIGAAVLAVVLLITLVGAPLIVVIAAAVLAVIAVTNALISLGSTLKGTAHHIMGDNEAAQRCFEIHSLNDYLRSLDNPFLNNVANVLEGIEIICSTIVIVYSIGQIAKQWPSIKQSFRWTLQNKDFANMKLSLKKGPLSLWNGVKTIGVKLYQNVPQLIKGGFKVSAVIGVLKSWKWVALPIKAKDYIFDLRDNAIKFINLANSGKSADTGKSSANKPAYTCPSPNPQNNVYQMFENNYSYINIKAA